MAWRYSTYINKVAAAGKAEYDIPMYVNTWLQQPRHSAAGEYPSGGPEPQVHDIWRFGAPSIDMLAPDLYVPQFAETCERFIRNGNPLFIPETSGQSAAECPHRFFEVQYHRLFAVRDRRRLAAGGRGRNATNGAPPPDALAQTYAILDYLAPVILDNQGKGTIAILEPMNDTNAPPQEVKLGDYTLTIRYGAGFGGRGGGRRRRRWFRRWRRARRCHQCVARAALSSIPAPATMSLSAGR